jgi:hypothetical protein
MFSRLVFAGLTATVLAATPSIGATTECGLERAFAHATKHHGERNIYGDAGALFFTAPMAVNTDGAPTSYHPDDPWGSRDKAINTICNGANARLPDGRKLNYAQCRELVAAFREAKAAGWEAPGKPKMEFYGVAARGATPCLIQSGSYAGYFVSSETGGLAEGSVAFAKSLRKLTDDPQNRRDTYRFGVEKVHALILPNETLLAPFTRDNVRTRAKARFEAWGGLDRFKKCVATIGALP